MIFVFFSVVWFVVGSFLGLFLFRLMIESQGLFMMCIFLLGGMIEVGLMVDVVVVFGLEGVFFYVGCMVCLVV